MTLRTLSLIFTLLITVGWSTWAWSQVKEAGIPSHSRVYVDGKPIAASRVIVRDGASFVDATTLAGAIGATVQPIANGLMITTQPKMECEKPADEGERFSEQFRKDVAGVADEIESLRAVVLKKEKVPLGPRFDAIDRKLTLSTTHVQTDADMAIYYALSYANNSLAIAYYKQSRGAGTTEEAHQLDSMMCAMESKFALMKGVLLPGGSCSVFKRMEPQAARKTDEAPQ